MTTDVRHFTVTVLHGTPKTAPQVTDLPMPPRVVRMVRFRIPPGPQGTVGFALGAAGVRTIPWGADQWIVGDDEHIEWPLSGQIDSGAWQLQAYNVDTYDHTLQITFVTDTLGPAVGPDILTPLNLNF